MVVNDQLLNKQARYLLNPPSSHDAYWDDIIKEMIAFIQANAEVQHEFSDTDTLINKLAKIVDTLNGNQFLSVHGPHQPIGVVPAILSDFKRSYEQQASLIVFLALVKPGVMFFKIPGDKFQNSIFDQGIQCDFLTRHVDDFEMRLIAAMITARDEHAIQTVFDWFSVREDKLRAFDQWYLRRMEGHGNEDFKTIGMKILAVRVSYGEYDNNVVLNWLSQHPDVHKALLDWVETHLIKPSRDYANYGVDFGYFLIWKLLQIKTVYSFKMVLEWLEKHQDFSKALWDWLASSCENNPALEKRLEKVFMRSTEIGAEMNDPLVLLRLFWIRYRAMTPEVFEKQVLIEMRGDIALQHARVLVELKFYHYASLIALLAKSTEDGYVYFNKDLINFFVDITLSNWQEVSIPIRIGFLKLLDPGEFKKRPKHAGLLQKAYDRFISAENKQLHDHLRDNMFAHIDLLLLYPFLLPCVFASTLELTRLTEKNDLSHPKFIGLMTAEQFPAHAIFDILAVMNGVVIKTVLSKPGFYKKCFDQFRAPGFVSELSGHRKVFAESMVLNHGQEFVHQILGEIIAQSNQSSALLVGLLKQNICTFEFVQNIAVKHNVTDKLLLLMDRLDMDGLRENHVRHENQVKGYSEKNAHKQWHHAFSAYLVDRPVRLANTIYALRLLQILVNVFEKQTQKRYIDSPLAHAKYVGYTVNLLMNRFPRDETPPYEEFMNDMDAVASTYRAAYPKSLLIREKEYVNGHARLRFAPFPYTNEQIKTQQDAAYRLVKQVNTLNQRLPRNKLA